MPTIAFDTLPDDARLWVFAAEEPVTGPAAEDLLGRVDAFLDGWNAHGHPLTAGREWREDRFLLVAVDQASVPPSGCSIDAMVRVLKEFEGEFEVTLTDHAKVVWRDDEGRIRVTDRPGFARLAKEDAVDLETPVFDTTLTRVGELREGGLEVPAGQGWHRRAFWRGIALVAGLALTGLSAALTPSGAGAQAMERAAFITRLGDDTVAVERLAIGDDVMEADVLMRTH